MRKRIGFLSFGHWQNSPGSRTQTAAEALNQTIELAEAAEAIGIDGAYVRVLLTVPNQLGVEYCARMLEIIAREIAPAFGWSPAAKPVQDDASDSEVTARLSC